MLTVIKFGASWCAPCKAFKPVFDSIAEDFKDKAIFEERDVEECEDDAVKYQIRSIPTIIFLNEENLVVARLVGTVNKETVIENLECLIKNTK